MSAHLAVLREASLIAAEKDGKSVIYHRNLSVLDEALMGFARTFGLDAERHPQTQLELHALDPNHETSPGRPHVSADAAGLDKAMRELNRQALGHGAPFALSQKTAKMVRWFILASPTTLKSWAAKPASREPACRYTSYWVT